MMRAAALPVLILLLAILAYVLLRQSSEAVAFASAAGSVLAAIFAAISAQATRDSATATRDSARATSVAAAATERTVEEMRRDRSQALSPVLTLERGCDYVEYRWPGAADEPGIAHVRHWRDPEREEPGRAFVLIRNFGGGPALDVIADFRLEDDGEPLNIPPQYRAVPHGSANRIMSSSPRTVTMRAGGRPSYISHVASVGHATAPNVPPGGERCLEIPLGIVLLAWARTLQNAPATGLTARTPVQRLNVHLTYDTLEETGLTLEFAVSLGGAVIPNAANGNAREVWTDREPVLRVYLAMHDEPRRRDAR